MVPWRWRPKSISKALSQPEQATAASERTTDDVQSRFQRHSVNGTYPEQQTALLLQAIRQPYQVTPDRAVPEIQNDTELLVKVTAAGLNPIDWKSP